MSQLWPVFTWLTKKVVGSGQYWRRLSEQAVATRSKMVCSTGRRSIDSFGGSRSFCTMRREAALSLSAMGSPLDGTSPVPPQHRVETYATLCAGRLSPRCLVLRVHVDDAALGHLQHLVGNRAAGLQHLSLGRIGAARQLLLDHAAVTGAK